MLRVGVDLVEVARVGRLAQRFGRAKLARIFTNQELDYAYTSTPLRDQRLAARLAAKEAFIKAWGAPLRLRDIEVVAHYGAPVIRYAGRDYPVSLSHTKETAVAVTVWELTGEGPPPQESPQAR